MSIEENLKKKILTFRSIEKYWQFNIWKSKNIENIEINFWAKNIGFDLDQYRTLKILDFTNSQYSITNPNIKNIVQIFYENNFVNITHVHDTNLVLVDQLSRKKKILWKNLMDAAYSA